jgi:PAS domain S-box-containing protein
MQDGSMRIVYPSERTYKTLNAKRWRYLNQVKRAIEQEELDAKQSQYFKDRLVNYKSELVYIYDLVNQCNLCVSCSITQLLGYSTATLPTNAALTLADLIHPDDLEYVVEHFQRFATLREGEMITLDYRMLHADGQWHWLCSQEMSFNQAIDGFPLQILGIIQDMTAGQQSEASDWMSNGLNRHEMTA